MDAKDSLKTNAGIKSQLFRRLADLIGISLCIFAFYFSVITAMEAYQYRSLFLTAILIMCFLTKPVSKRAWLRSLDFLAAAAALAIGIYQGLYHNEILLHAGAPTRGDLLCSVLILILVLEATRRSVGWQLVVLVLLFLAYQWEGLSRYLPGLLAHGGTSLKRILDIQFTTFDGLYGVPLGVVAKTVVIFIVFASILEETRAGDFFIELARSAVGKTRGGPAKIAVVSSAFFGMLSGSAIANVVSTGSFTIPMMKRSGYTAEEAGAIEAAASSGGQIMPPIMGAAAFLIAAFLERSYFEVMTKAAIPALLYFVAIYAAVHFIAVKRGASTLAKGEIPGVMETLRWGGHLLLPLISIIALMMAGFTAEFSGSASTCFLILISCLSKRTRMSVKSFLRSLARAGHNMIPPTAACASAGVIIAVMVDSGLGARATELLQEVSHGHLPLVLLLAMIGSLILGMGVPTTAAYVIVAILIAPALSKFGVSMMAAHLFAFYFAILSGLTPPIALAAYAAAPIAGADPFRVGIRAFLISIPSFIVPFLFCYNPSLVAEGSIWHTLLYFAMVICGVTLLAASIVGCLTKGLKLNERFLCIIVSVLLLYPKSYLLNLLGFVSFAIVYLFLIRKRRFK